MNILSIIRLLLTLAVTYLFFYEYIGKKYVPSLKSVEQSQQSKKQLAQIFNFTYSELKGDGFSTNNLNQRNITQLGSINDLDHSYDKLLKNSENKKHNKNDNLLQNLIEKVGFKNSLKKVDSYVFTFYNWYRIEFTFTDLGYDSQLQIRITQQKKGSHNIIEKVSFKLPQHFYKHKLNSDGLNVNFQTKQFSLNISQQFVLGLIGDKQNDGLQSEDYFWLSRNKSKITNLDYLKFGSDKTITYFNLTLLRKDLQLRANLTHVIRHNQCFNNQDDKVIKHKCLGGYSQGKINFFYFIRGNYDEETKSYSGKWQRQTFNLDNSRTRTTYTGYRSKQPVLLSYISSLKQSLISLPSILSNLNLSGFSLFSKVFYNHKSIQIDFVGFNKLEYYAKKDKIQKQRWVGMTLYQSLNKNGLPKQQTSIENYLFVNGNMHPIYQLQTSIPLSKNKLAPGKVLTFKNNIQENHADRRCPSFQIEFQIFNYTYQKSTNFLNNHQVFRIDGYWSGYINQSTLFSDKHTVEQYKLTEEFDYVGFYNITGTIKITQQVY